MDFDIPSYVNLPEVEAYNNHDSNEPSTLVVSPRLPHNVAKIEIVVLNEIYRQPDSPLLLRPPKV